MIGEMHIVYLRCQLASVMAALMAGPSSCRMDASSVGMVTVGASILQTRRLTYGSLRVFVTIRRLFLAATTSVVGFNLIVSGMALATADLGNRD